MDGTLNTSTCDSTPVFSFLSLPEPSGVLETGNQTQEATMSFNLGSRPTLVRVIFGKFYGRFVSALLRRWDETIRAVRSW